MAMNIPRYNPSIIVKPCEKIEVAPVARHYYVAVNAQIHTYIPNYANVLGTFKAWELEAILSHVYKWFIVLCFQFHTAHVLCRLYTAWDACDCFNQEEGETIHR